MLNFLRRKPAQTVSVQTHDIHVNAPNGTPAAIARNKQRMARIDLAVANLEVRVLDLVDERRAFVETKIKYLKREAAIRALMDEETV